MNEALWRWKWATVSKTVDVLVYGCNWVVVSFDGKCWPRAARILKSEKKRVHILVSIILTFEWLTVKVRE